MMIRFTFQKVNSDGSEEGEQQGGEREGEKPREGLKVNESSQFFILFNLPENSIPKCTEFVEVTSS